MDAMINAYKQDIASLEKRISRLLLENDDLCSMEIDKRIDLLRCERWELMASLRSMEEYMACVRQREERGA